MELIHTCYRIGEIDRSVAFYEALGFEERRRMPIREEAINVFMGLPGDGDRLELTYNHGVDSYELGTGYNHIALTVDDINGTLERLGEQGIEPEKPPYRVREGGSLIAFVRDPGRLPDRADREEPLGRVLRRVSAGGHRLRVELVPVGGLHLHRLVVEAHGRDPRVRARRRGPGGDGRAR